MQSQKNNKVVSSLFWSFFERIGNQGVSLIISVILARLILPSEYGVIAAAQIFIQLATSFVAGGFGNALIQKKDADDNDCSTMFIFNIVFSVSLYGIIYVSSPMFVKILNDSYDYDLLIKVIRVLGIGIVLSSFNSFYRALLSKKLCFRKIFLLTLCGTIISATVGIFMAYKGFGVWALVTQNLLNLLINSILFVLTSDYRPKLYFSFTRFKPMFKFGVNLMISGLLISIYADLTSLAIGNKYTSDDLAYYQKGINFPKLLVLNIITAINTALFPIMSNIDSFEQQKQMVRKFNRISAFVITPMMFGFAAVADSFVEIVLTEKWLPCVVFLQISCLNYAIQPISMASLQFLKATGRATEYLVLDIIRKIVGVVLLVIAIVMDKGVWLIAVSEVVSNFIAVFINMYPGKKHIEYSIKEQVRDVLPKFILSAVMFAGVMVLGSLEMQIMLKFILQISGGICIYLAGAKLFKMKEFGELLDMGKRILRKT